MPFAVRLFPLMCFVGFAVVVNPPLLHLVAGFSVVLFLFYVQLQREFIKLTNKIRQNVLAGTDNEILFFDK